MAGKKLSPLYGIGSVTLLTVLLVLCLTLFAVMALANAQADWRLSEKNATSVQAYYAADAQATQMLALLDTYAQQNPGHEEPPVLAADLQQTLLQQIPEAAAWNLSTTNEGEIVFLAAAIPVQENQTLEVELSLSYQPRSLVRVERWQVTPHMEGFTGDESLPVYTFDF